MVTSSIVARPADVAEVADVLRAAGNPARTVTIQGAGTKTAWGGSLSPVDIVLSTTSLSGVVAYEPADRVVTVRAGTPLRELQDVLAASGQRLCVESGYPDATIGGVLATNEAGPLRLRYGSARDLLIGVEFVRADGVVAHSGGRVVKNVAGYDLGRLLGGSYGTIGVVTTTTFRLHPLPAARCWLLLRKGPLLTPGVVQGTLLNNAVVPSAVECDLPGSGGGELAVLLEGSVAGVAARAAALRSVLSDVLNDVSSDALTDAVGDALTDAAGEALADAAGEARTDAAGEALTDAAGEALTDAAGDVAGDAVGDIVVAQAPPPWWGRYPFGDGDVGLRLAAPVSLVPELLAVLRDRFGAAIGVRGSLGSGVLHAGLPSTVDSCELADALADVRARLAGTGGSCVVVSAPPSIRDGLDLWGEVAGLELMRRLKAQFDPAGRFARGRFVGGL